MHSTATEQIHAMSGKKYFRECCRELDIDCDAMFILGAQESSKKTVIRFDLPAGIERKNQRYAVNHLKSRDIFIVWCLDVSDCKRSFYFPREKLTDFEGGTLVYSEPSTRPCRNSEKAYAFGRESVRRFLISVLVNG